MIRSPTPASTVMLLRDGPTGPEVLLLRRHARSGFLPDMYVFPGGRVEASDEALFEEAGGLTLQGARSALPMVPAERAGGYFAAAIRETFEEAGLLLVRSRSTEQGLERERVAQHALELGCHRLDVQAGHSELAPLLRDRGLRLDTDALTVHARWITPESVSRRFDTVFFTALAPEGQLARHDGVESTEHVWIRPEDALGQAQAGERQILFPTACNLETLCGFGHAADAWEASRARRVVTVLPRLEERDGARMLVIPEEAGYRTRTQAMPGKLP